MNIYNRVILAEALRPNWFFYILNDQVYADGELFEFDEYVEDMYKWLADNDMYSMRTYVGDSIDEYTIYKSTVFDLRAVFTGDCLREAVSHAIVLEERKKWYPQ